MKQHLPFLCTDGVQAHRGIARTSVYLDVQHAEVISQRQMNEPMLPHKAGQERLGSSWLQGADSQLANANDRASSHVVLLRAAARGCFGSSKGAVHGSRRK